MTDHSEMDSVDAQTPMTVDADDGVPKARPDRPEHIPTVYNAPVLRYRADPLGPRSFFLAISILGVVIGLGTTGPPEWVLATITAVSAASLPVTAWWWWRAVTAPRREHW